jgi:5'-3' exonuclease
MGVKGLSRFLKLKYPSIYSEYPIEFFKGKSLVIDTFGFLYKYLILSSSMQGMIQSLISFIYSFLQYDITPIFILDGFNKAQKIEEIKNRKEKRNKLLDDIQHLSQAIENLRLEKELSPEDIHVLEKHQQLIDKKKNASSFLFEKQINKFCIHTLIERLNKLQKQSKSIGSVHIEMSQQLFNALGIQWIQADGDAEILCSQLVKQGTAYAAVSGDSDLFALLTPRVITSWDINQKGKCIMIELSTLLHSLQLSDKSFQDMCILCGTDYNKNIPRVGPVNAYKLITQYKSIEEMEKTGKWNCSILQYPLVRKILSFHDEQQQQQQQEEEKKMDWKLPPWNEVEKNLSLFLEKWDIELLPYLFVVLEEVYDKEK